MPCRQHYPWRELHRADRRVPRPVPGPRPVRPERAGVTGAHYKQALPGTALQPATHHCIHQPTTAATNPLPSRMCARTPLTLMPRRPSAHACGASVLQYATPYHPRARTLARAHRPATVCSIANTASLASLSPASRSSPRLCLMFHALSFIHAHQVTAQVSNLHQES